MVYLEWNDNLLIGIKELDGHHRHLVDLLNRTYTICMSYTTPEDLIRIVDELIDYVNYHFAAEERIMDQHDYPGLLQQKQEHEVFKLQLDDLKTKISGTVSFSIMEAVELTELLGDWVKNHIMDVDNKFGGYMNKV